MLQELPADHPIVTAYAADLAQRFDIAAAALQPQGQPLLQQQDLQDSATQTRRRGMQADNVEPTAAAAAGIHQKNAAGSSPDEVFSSSSGGNSRGSASTAAAELVFMSRSWVVGVGRHTGEPGV
jgi:hypothetical protein